MALHIDIICSQPEASGFEKASLILSIEEIIPSAPPIIDLAAS